MDAASRFDRTEGGEEREWSHHLCFDPSAGLGACMPDWSLAVVVEFGSPSHSYTAKQSSLQFKNRRSKLHTELESHSMLSLYSAAHAYLFARALFRNGGKLDQAMIRVENYICIKIEETIP